MLSFNDWTEDQMTLGKVGAPNAAVYTASKARRRRFDQGCGA
jgi:hypothetical protein